MPDSPQLRVLISPRLQPLLEHLTASCRRAPLPPRELETIVVQSQGMRRWLTLQFADAFGCAGSLAVPFPARFVRDIAQRLQPDRSTRDDDDPFSRDALSWRIDALLQSLPSHEAAYGPLRAYLAGADERARFGLATQIAGRMDDYQMYRADLLQEWEAGRDTPGTAHAAWQAALWRTLCAEIGGSAPHMAASLRRTIDALRGASAPSLPPRIAVFGVTALPPLFIELLAALAHHLPVTVYSSSLDPGSLHPLAVSFCPQSREFLGALISQGAAITPLKDATETGTALLPTLQRELSVRAAAGSAGHALLTLEANDATLRVHSAHGQVRQLEILRDQLLAALAEDPSLRPHDLLLLVPDAAEWAPLVDAVFGVSDSDAVRLPYRIADRPMRRTQPAADALSRLLALEGGRLARSEVFHILAHPLARHAADLTEADVDALEQLTQRANVRWGYDAEARRALELPAYEEASWRAGLDRLLLGVAVGRNDDVVLGLLAESGDTSGEPEALARLATWVDALARTLADWREPRTLASWCTSIIAAAEYFLKAEEPGDQQQLVALANTIQELSTLGDLAGYSASVSFGVVRDWIEGQLDGDGFGTGFLQGGMTVAALKPMRSLPFRVIAVAGLDDGVFPRRERRAAFDMLEQEHHVGDRDLRGDDRQLFLDLLLAAKDRLILSFSGSAVSDNSPRAPSVVIDELLDHLDRRTGGQGRSQLVVTHPLQPFSSRYFVPDRDPRLFTFSNAQAGAARASTQCTDADQPFVTAPLGNTSATAVSADAPMFELTLDDLTDCWTNPSRFYCRNALRFSLGDDAPDVADDELFTLDPMQQGGIKARMLAGAMRTDRDDDRERRRALAGGELPIGEMGMAWHASLATQVAEVLASLPDVAAVTVPISVEGTRWRLRGRMDGIRGNVRYIVRAGGIRAKHRIRAWVEHVVMCAAREHGAAELPATTVLMGKEGEDERIEWVNNATAVLASLVGVVSVANTTPLPFFAQAGWAWLDASRPKPTSGKGSKTEKKEPMAAATMAFLEEPGYASSGGDNHDPYVDLCFRGTSPMAQHRDQFEQLSKLLFGPWLSAGASR